MKRDIVLAMWQIACFLTLVVGASAVSLEGEGRLELVVVKTHTPEQARYLNSFEEQVDLWVHPIAKQWTMLAMPARRHDELFQLWTAAGMTVNVKEADVQALIDRVDEQSRQFHLQNKGRSSKDTEGLLLDHTQYTSYNGIRDACRTLRDAYPSLVFFDESGNSPSRPLTPGNRINDVIEIGANRGSTPVIMLEVNIHAREHITNAANLYFMDWVLARYGSDADATFLLDNYHIVIMPMANPDGYEHSRTSSRLWRKNRRNTGSSCLGVDLNRNFDVQWNGGSSNACSDTYRGPSPASEPETQATVNIFNEHRERMAIYMPVHCYSQLLLLPYSYSSNPNIAGAKPPNSAFHYEAAEAMRQAMLAATGLNYIYGLPVETINYNAFGTSGDWAIRTTEDRILSIAYELRPDRNEVGGSAGFILDASHIIPTGQEYTASIVAVARYVTENGTN